MTQEQYLSPEQRIALQRKSVIMSARDRLAPFDVVAAAEKQHDVFAAYSNAIEPTLAPEMQSPIGGVVVENEANNPEEARQAVEDALKEYGNAN